MRIYYFALIKSFCYINPIYAKSIKWLVTASIGIFKDNLFDVSEFTSLINIISIVFRDNFGSASTRFEVINCFVIKVFKTFILVLSNAYSLIKGFIRILSRVNNLFVI